MITKNVKSSLVILGLSPLLAHCSQEAQVGSTTETKLLAEYEATTKDYDNTKPTVLDGTITGTQLTETSISLTWSKATDNADGSSATALSYRVYMSTQANIETAEQMVANGTALTEWTGDQATIEITIPTLKKLNNLYVNIVVQDEKGNQTPYTMLSLKNDSPFGDLTLSGTKDGSSFSTNLTAHSLNSTLIYDAYVVQTANSSYSLGFANADASLTWFFDDLTLDTANAVTATRATDGKINLDLTGGTLTNSKAYRIAMDATDKTAPKFIVKENRPILELEFELRLKTSKILSYATPTLYLTALKTALSAAAGSTLTFAAKTEHEIVREIYSEDLTNCTLKNLGYNLRQKIVVASNGATWPAFPTTNFTTPAPSLVSSTPWSVGLKGRSTDRDTAFTNKSTIASGLTVDKNDEFVKAGGAGLTYFERVNSFKSAANGGCNTTSPCTFSTIADVVTKFPNTPNLAAKSTETLSDLAGTSQIFDAEIIIFAKKATGLTAAGVTNKKMGVNFLYESVNGGVPSLIYAKMGTKLVIDAGTGPIEAFTDYTSAVTTMQTVYNAWAQLSDWVELTDDQQDKISFLYKYYNRCQ